MEGLGCPEAAQGPVPQIQAWKRSVGLSQYRPYWVLQGEGSRGGVGEVQGSAPTKLDVADAMALTVMG